MRDFLYKVLSNKTYKLIFCIVVAIPIFLLYLLIAKNQATNEEVYANVDNVVKPQYTINSTTDEATSDETVTVIVEEENLDYKSFTSEGSIRVFTVGDITFNEEYIKESVRPKMITELIENKVVSNATLGQSSIQKLYKYDGYKIAYIEIGNIRDSHYIATYTKVNKNLVYTCILAYPNELESSLIDLANANIENSATIIQQARQKTYQ